MSSSNNTTTWHCEKPLVIPDKTGRFEGRIFWGGQFNLRLPDPFIFQEELI